MSDQSPWQTIKTAPRDGTEIDLTWMEDGEPQEIWPMLWDPDFTNGLIPCVVGFWRLAGGEVTWCEEGDGGPTHWRPRLKVH